MTIEEARTENDELDQALTVLAEAPLDHEAVDRAVSEVWAAHAGQRRKSGEPFAVHPIAVAAILAEQRLSTVSVIAGLLHDVLEDTSTSAEELEATWGDEITGLVEGLTKIVRVARRGDPRREKAATYRKLLLAAADDARVLVIKLADRLHNMRTIAALSPARQTAIANETMAVYAPIAHRLGMRQIKDELQDLAFSVINPDGWELAGLVQSDVASGAGELDEYRRAVVDALSRRGISSTVTTRVKHRWSIHQKLSRRGDETPLYDVLGMRVIVSNVEECYAALGTVHDLWPPRFDRFHDYIAVPKANLYQSLHTTVNVPAGTPLEIQIRTGAQDEIAEYGIAAHWQYKEQLSSGGPQRTRDWIKRTALHQQDGSLDEAFDALKADAFANEIYVCSPRGDIYVLPEGACPVDFAYAVHTELGHQCVGARVSGRLRALNTPLHNGDVVEILSRPGHEPSKDWLAWARTPRARQRIRHWHQSKDEQEQVETGWKLLVGRAKQNRLGPWAQRDRLHDSLVAIGYSNPDSVALEVAAAPDRARYFVQRIVRSLTHDEEQPVRRRGKSTSETVVVEDMDNVAVRFAQCCSPQPGDSLLGYVSIGRGISVHQRGCRQLRGADIERLVDVYWREHALGGQVELELVVRDRQGILIDVAEAVYANGGEIVDIHLHRSGVIAKGNLVCWTPGAWEGLLSRLSSVPGVLRVARRQILATDE